MKTTYAWLAGATCYNHRTGCDCQADATQDRRERFKAFYDRDMADFCLTAIIYTKTESGEDFTLEDFIKAQGATEPETAREIYTAAELIKRLPQLDRPEKYTRKVTSIEAAPDAKITKTTDGKSFELPIIYILDDGQRIAGTHRRKLKKEVSAYLERLPEQPRGHSVELDEAGRIICHSYTISLR